jgi:nucleotide-binding universal stress UspA family protein
VTAIDPFFFARAPALLDQAKKCAREHLERTAEVLHHAGWNTATDVILGNPRRVISGFARDWKADLVMVGSRDLSDAKRLFLGSTTQSLLRRAPCSIEIVRTFDRKNRPDSDTGMKLLVATDGSEFSEAAIQCVASRPWPEGTRIKVISAPALVLFLRECPYFERQQVEALNLASLEDSQAAVALAVGTLSKSGLPVHSDVPLLHDTPSKIILDEAAKWHADMIVVGSHGRSGFDRFTMGSVSEAVALHAGCSVEVIRECKPAAE